MDSLWERGQTEAVLKVGYKGTNQLAAVGITPVPRTGTPRYYLVMGSLLGPQRPESEKLSPYECGFEAFEDAHMQFDVRYYLIAILFIAFDLEIAFVFPWAIVFRSLGVVGLIEMGIFLGLLIIGFVYVWKKGALEWE